MNTSNSQLWTYAIAIITPLLIAGGKKLIPTVPKWALPCIAPLVGVLVGLGLNAVGAAHLSWVDAAQLGALGVFIREVVDQAVVKRMASPPA